MPIIGSRKSVVATAGGTLLATGAGTANDARPVAITNRGTASVDLGGAGVTSGSGVELTAGESRTFTLMGGDDLYAIAASGTVRVDVLAGRS